MPYYFYTGFKSAKSLKAIFSLSLFFTFKIYLMYTNCEITLLIFFAYSISVVSREYVDQHRLAELNLDPRLLPFFIRILVATIQSLGTRQYAGISIKKQQIHSQQARSDTYFSRFLNTLYIYTIHSLPYMLSSQFVMQKVLKKQKKPNRKQSKC